MPTPPKPTSGIIRLLNVPFDNSYKNVLDFETDTDRYNYMVSRQIKNNDGSTLDYYFADCQYSRRDGTLRVPTHIDKLYNCNYLMFRNPFYTNKWFYCFVTGQRYINDNCTEIRIETDVYSTWISRADIQPSFVEREHTNDDTPGNNTIPEGLETGEIITSYVYDIEAEFDPIVAVAYTGDKIGDEKINKYGGSYNGIPSSIPFLITYMYKLNSLVDKINESGQGNAIFTIFTIPRLAVNDLLEVGGIESRIIQKGYYELPTHQQQVERTIFEPFKSNPGVPKPGADYFVWAKGTNDYDFYEPRNKKLLTYPYIFMAFNPPNGSSKIYRYENFYGRYPIFNAISEINPNPTVLVTPIYYQCNDNNLQESTILNGYPTLGYKNDVFNTWLAQNSNIINIATDRSKFNYDVSTAHNNIAQQRESTNALTGLISSAVGGVANALTGNIGGLLNNVIGGASGLINSGYNMQDLEWNQVSNSGNWMYDVREINAQVEKQEMLPDTGSLSSSNATLLGYGLMGKSTFTIRSIKKEYAERIDKYFDMFGYQTNILKQPNIKGRQNWNYVKTININITGKIPLPDLNRLKLIFDNGVTIWHNPNTIYDYELQNPIIGGE